jgi:hypothetical protein
MVESNPFYARKRQSCAKYKQFLLSEQCRLSVVALLKRNWPCLSDNISSDKNH